MKPSFQYLQNLLILVKQRLGIMSDIRDEYLAARISAELQALSFEKGVVFDENDMNLTMFIVDYTSWKHQSIGNNGAMPIDMRIRLNNILVKYTGGDSVDL